MAPGSPIAFCESISVVQTENHSQNEDNLVLPSFCESKSAVGTETHSQNECRGQLARAALLGGWGRGFGLDAFDVGGTARIEFGPDFRKHVETLLRGGERVACNEDASRRSNDLEASEVARADKCEVRSRGSISGSTRELLCFALCADEQVEVLRIVAR